MRLPRPSAPAPRSSTAPSRRAWLLWLGLGGPALAQQAPPVGRQPQPPGPARPGAAPAPAPRAGSVEKLSGQVQLVRGQQRAPLRQGGQVVEGDRIVTGAKSECVIRMTDASVISIRPHTDCLIDEYQFTTTDSPEADEDALVVKLTKGALRLVTGAIAKLNPIDVRIVTPTATIGVRGTDFETLILEDGQALELDTVAEPDPDAPPPPEADVERTPGTYTTVFEGETVMAFDGRAFGIAAGQSGFSPFDMQLRDARFGLIQAVPRGLFRPRVLDRGLRGIQQNALGNLQRDFASRFNRAAPARNLQRIMPGFNPLAPGSSGPNPFVPGVQDNPFVNPGGAVPGGGALPGLPGGLGNIIRGR
ncbi:MAG TPA: FecR family protein [Burkholderiaceae bacterium]|nr:FecR family protein [Burkholderiaceae bacterium]